MPFDEYGNAERQTLTLVIELDGCLIVKFNVAALSHPTALVKCFTYTPLEVYVVPFQVYETHSATFVVEVVGILIVKCNVTTLSQPATFVKVCVGEFVDELYVTPYHIKLPQAVAEVSPVLVAFGAATPEPDALTQPFTVCVTV